MMKFVRTDDLIRSIRRKASRSNARSAGVLAWIRYAVPPVLALVAVVLAAQSVWAAPVLHEAPEGSEWVMADWMFLSFIIFAGASFVAFLFALKIGLLSNIEDAKYYILEIDEPDYYTPDWAKEGDVL
ncbi:MAG: hypothetical protein ACK2UO_05955 [Caldilineaceae bacterium]|jgi:hypothetical protein